MWEAVQSIISLSLLLVLSQLSPGPDIFYVCRTALSGGFRAGFSVGLGISLDFAVQACIVAVAGQWVMQQSWSPWVLRAAACWLLYLAWRIFPRPGRSQSTLPGDASPAPAPSLAHCLGSGFLCNILNPKCTLFICGLMLHPQATYAPLYTWYTPALLAAFMLANILGWGTWCALLQWPGIRSAYLRHTAAIDALFAGLLALFAAIILL